MYSRLALLLVFVGSLVFRLYYVSDFHHAFTIDQARDMLEIRKIVVGHDPVFVGPITSLNGIFLGPFWFYLNIPAFIIGGGNPTALAFFQVILIHLGTAIFWFYFRKKDESYAFWGSAILLLSPRLFEAGTYSFNANTTPVFVLLTLLLLDSVLRSASTPKTLFLGFLSGLTLQLEAAFGILIFPLCFFWLLIAHKPLRPLLFGFGATLIPQLLFEIKNKFMMTGVFLTEFSGGSSILGQRLSLVEKFSDRTGHYLGALGAALPLPSQLAFLLFPLGVIYLYSLCRQKKLDRQLYRFFLINLSLIFLSLALYFVYPNRLKDWWSINFVVPYILIVTLALSRLPRMIALVPFLLFALPFLADRYNYRKNERSNDRGLLLNQVEVVDWVYQKAEGKGFKAYVFTPAIYDYNYQYLFWWYGQSRYHYLPEVLTYQEGVPEYIENNKLYWKNAKKAEGIVFLIVESSVNLDAFSHLCPVERALLVGGIAVEKRINCSTNK